MASSGAGRTLEGEIDLGRVFETFTRHTEQKQTHGIILRELLRNLKERNILLFRDREEEGCSGSSASSVVSLVDLGCGDGCAAVEMIQAIVDVQTTRFGGGGDNDGAAMVDYYGLDGNERFVARTRSLLGEAEGVARYIRHIDVRQADVLDGKPLPFQQKIDRALVTMGHVLYYAHSKNGIDETKRNIAAVIDSVVGLLGSDSMSLFVHSAPNCPLAALRASVADSVVARPSVFVAEIAKERGLDSISFNIPYRIQFPRLSSEQWEDCKDPVRYNLPQNRDDPQFIVILELLMFVAQRSSKGLAQEGRLGVFVDALRAHIDARDGTFEGISSYQIVLPLGCSSDARAVEAAVRQVEASCAQHSDHASKELREATGL